MRRRRSKRESKGVLFRYEDVQESSIALSQCRRSKEESRRDDASTKSETNVVREDSLDGKALLFSHRLLSEVSPRHRVIQQKSVLKRKRSLETSNEPKKSKKRKKKKRQKRTKRTDLNIENAKNRIGYQDSAWDNKVHVVDVAQTTGKEKSCSRGSTRVEVTSLDMKAKGGLRKRILEFNSLQNALLTIQGLENAPEHTKPLSVSLYCPSI